MKTKMQDLQLTPLAPKYQKELDKINNKKIKYVEPEGYFTESMRKILEEGEKENSQNAQKLKSSKNKKTTKIIIDDKEISRIALGINVQKK